MTQDSLEEFYHGLRQQVLAGAEAREDFLEAEFAENITTDLVGAGVIEGFDECHYRAPKGTRVDGFWFNENEASLDLFIVDYSNKEALESLTKTDVTAIFKRLENFFTTYEVSGQYSELEETSPGWGLARSISEKKNSFSRVNFYLLSGRSLSDKLKLLEEKNYKNWTFAYHIWDVSRIHRMRTAHGAREEILINLSEYPIGSLQCLPAHIESSTYKSYLIVMPATILAELYGRYGSRLLEQNVRSFLQARASVNKGIRSTIMNDPEMFFAYNNGITATAQEVETVNRNDGIYITSIKDLQIVNGGQTTASLFHTHRKDKSPLDKIFVQVKLSIVDNEKSEEVVPKISEYANTQNKVNAADFFSNHPFHIKMERFSRNKWAPRSGGATHDTKWFYERARGQFLDAQAKLSAADQKRFLGEFPKHQMFTKTDMAKFENTWDDKPTWVNKGAQKNFSHYAERIGAEYEKHPDNFNELYYERIIARAIIFKRAEKIVSDQSWYGGHRANIVPYTLALLGKLCWMEGKSIDFKKIWSKQDITSSMRAAIEITSDIVHESITNPPEARDIGEWCKTDLCWTRLQEHIPYLKDNLPEDFFNELVSNEEIKEEKRDGITIQRIDNGIEAQTRVISIDGGKWKIFLQMVKPKNIFSPKEIGIIEYACSIPKKIPSEKQAAILVTILEKAELEGINIAEL